MTVKVKKKYSMPEKYKGYALEDALTMACTDAICDICKLFGITNSSDEVTDVTIVLETILESEIRKNYFVSEED